MCEPEQMDHFESLILPKEDKNKMVKPILRDYSMDPAVIVCYMVIVHMCGNMVFNITDCISTTDVIPWTRQQWIHTTHRQVVSHNRWALGQELMSVCVR
jgi:hypothetical protein